LAQARAQEITAKTPGQIQETEAKTAATVAAIPGTEAAGHQTMIQNGQTLMPQQGVGMAIPHEEPLQTPLAQEPYTGGFPQ
jgi:hypothetical protein